MHVFTTLADGTLASPRHVSRATILILAVVLLAMGVGARLPEEQSGVELLWGGFGLTAYLILELAARYKSSRRDVKNRSRVMHKLDQIVTTDFAIKFVRRHASAESGANVGENALQSAQRYLLVIDDEPQVRDLITRMLKTEGIAVRSCESLEGALELAPGAVGILCDVHLAGIDGADVVRRLRHEGYSGHVIMMSGDSDLSTVKESLTAGIDDYLIKPFEKQALLQRVRRLVAVEQDARESADRGLCDVST
ncbi:MAG TPA: response regulator [Pirellulales bacterium]|nr:response regulator [Pirellulales bacterium]